MKNVNENENILFIDRVRKKKKSFWNLFFFSPYYEKENISFKEKVYTMMYNLKRTGFTTKGELLWAERMMELDYGKYNEISEQFKKDYREFEIRRERKNSVKIN